MRASWSRIVTAISAAAVLAASVGLPGTLVGRKGERPVGVAAPPVVAHTVVPAAPVPAGAAPSPGPAGRASELDSHRSKADVAARGSRTEEAEAPPSPCSQRPDRHLLFEAGERLRRPEPHAHRPARPEQVL